MMANRKKFYNPWAVLLIVAVFTVVYLVYLYPQINRWGMTAAEGTLALPGDGAEPGKLATSTRGVTIHAPADEVWKWVVQLGQERAGFYSNDWLENLVLSDIHNVDEIRSEWQVHRQGDHVLGAGGVIYQQSSYWPIRVYEEDKATYLWGAIVVLPVDDHTSRLYVRTYNPPAAWFPAAVSALTYDWMHFVMERGMLLGIKARAEGTLGSEMLIHTVANLGWMAATLAMVAFLFLRRRGWWWGLIPLAYSVAIFGFTADIWAALAGFLWGGVIAAGFLAFWRSWGEGLTAATGLGILVFVLAPQPHIAFGVIFLLITLGMVSVKVSSRTLTSKLHLNSVSLSTRPG
jgi:hypothetical protein